MNDLIRLSGNISLMSYDNQSHSFSIHFFQQIHNLLARLTVQRSGRLISQYNLRTGNQCPCYGNPLFLTRVIII